MKVRIVFEAEYPDPVNAYRDAEQDVNNLDTAPDNWVFDGIYEENELPTWAMRRQKNG